ncbi:unnamed protein product [Chrysoparadoxa australica]
MPRGGICLLTLSCLGCVMLFVQAFRAGGGVSHGRVRLARMRFSAPQMSTRASRSSVSSVKEEDPPQVARFQYGTEKTDETGLPLIYEPELIQKYWDKRKTNLNKRWSFFLGLTVPFVTRVIKDYTSGSLVENERELARDLRIIIEKLGPTFIKLGQALSIRPDVLGPAAAEELAKLQDAVKPFSNEEAFKVLDAELGAPASEIFSTISAEPVASASLAQVYRATLKSTGEEVAVKIQRPDLLPIVTRDLYVAKRAVATYQGISDRWTAQTTDYNSLFEAWATGFYQELEFRNEANNQEAMKDVLADFDEVMVPRVYWEHTSRRLLVTEWVDGSKLLDASPEEIRGLTKVAQDAFLTQLLGSGLFHADPHPGNLLRLEPHPDRKAKLALLDFGLVAQLKKEDTETMVAALIHTANQNYAALIQDMQQLNVLPADADPAVVEPVMRRVIGPYVFQVGYRLSLSSNLLLGETHQGNMPAFLLILMLMLLLLLLLLQQIPFSIPDYFALVARAIGILEGIALTGDPDYRIVMEAYPFVSRKVISSSESPALREVLREIIYEDDGEELNTRRLVNLLSYALGAVAHDAEGKSGVFIDFDQVPSTGARLEDMVDFLLSDKAKPLRTAAVGELAQTIDLLLRQTTRRNVAALSRFLAPPKLPFLPRLPVPTLLDTTGDLVDTVSPQLELEDEIFLKNLADLVAALTGMDISGDMSGVELLQSLLRPTDPVKEALEVALGIVRKPDSPQAAALAGK